MVSNNPAVLAPSKTSTDHQLFSKIPKHSKLCTSVEGLDRTVTSLLFHIEGFSVTKGDVSFSCVKDRLPGHRVHISYTHLACFRTVEVSSFKLRNRKQDNLHEDVL